MYPWKKIKYFTYQEVLDLFPALRPASPHDKTFADDWFSKILDASDLELAIYGVSEFITDDLVKDVVDALMTIVYQRHSDHFVFWKEMSEDEDYDLAVADFEKYIRTILNIIELTTPKYISLLQSTEYYSENPIAPLESETRGKTRFNDTPQDIGEWNDDEHATNVSDSSNKSYVDSGSIVSRLDEAFKNWKSTILEWSNEFNQAFLVEEQVL